MEKEIKTLNEFIDHFQTQIKQAEIAKDKSFDIERAKEDIKCFETAIKALKGVDTSDMLYDIYMAGVNMAGEYQGCWVRFKDIERIVLKHTGGKV